MKSGCLKFLSVLASGSALLAADPKTSATNPQATVKWEGHVSKAPTGSAGETNLIFKADSHGSFKLKRTEMSEPLFLDTNLWSKVLLLTGKADGKIFEVTGNLHSVKDGREQELYYYCDVCSITSSLPGLCQCCREPSRLVEAPSRR